MLEGWGMDSALGKLWRNSQPFVRVEGEWVEVESIWVNSLDRFNRVYNPYLTQGERVNLERWYQGVDDHRSYLRVDGETLLGCLSTNRFTINGVDYDVRGMEMGGYDHMELPPWKWLELQFYWYLDSRHLNGQLLIDDHRGKLRHSTYEYESNITKVTYELNVCYQPTVGLYNNIRF